MFHKKCYRAAEASSSEYNAVHERNQRLEALLADIAKVFPAIEQTSEQKKLISAIYWSFSDRPLEMRYRVSELHAAAEHVRKQAAADKSTADEAYGRKILDEFRAPKKK